MNQERYDLGGGLFGGGGLFLVRYDVHDFRVEFKAWEAYGTTMEGVPLFGEGLGLEDPERLTPLLAGCVKWDGCANFDWPAAEHCMMHVCERSQMVALGELLATVWDRCIALCPEADPGPPTLAPAQLQPPK